MDFNDVECQFVSTSSEAAEHIDMDMTYHRISDRIPKDLSELVQDTLEESILDDFQEVEESSTATIDDIKINQEQADGVVDEPEED